VAKAKISHEQIRIDRENGLSIDEIAK